MKLNSVTRILCLALALAASMPVRAEDIDLFAGRTNIAAPNLIIVLDKSGDQGVGNAQNAMSMEEARRYLGSLSVTNGNNTFFQTNGGTQVLDLAATDATHTMYKSPSSDGCAANFILYISNGPPASSE